MASQAVGRRGIEDRTLEHRITTPVPLPAPMPQDFPPFDLSLLGLSGQASIPDALAYGLRWQAELNGSESAPLEEQQALAEKLLTLYDYLTVMETEVERDPRDGALLYRDPIKLFAATRLEKTRLLETVDGRGIPVGDATIPALPAWAPSIFPRGLSAEGRARYPARPRALAEIPPFGSTACVQHWVRLRAARPAPPIPDSPAKLPARAAGKTAGLIIAAEPTPPKPVAARALDAALDRASERYNAGAKRAPYTATPLVTNAIRQLSRYTLRDLRTATNAQQHSTYEDDKLITNTEILLYHSVFTVVLDRAGKPFDLRIDEAHAGLLDYALLVPPPGSQMSRALPAPGGVNVSVRTRGDSQYRIEDGKIVKLLQGGVGGFMKVGYGATDQHELHLKIQQFMNNRQANIASVSAEAAFNPMEITLDRIRPCLSDLAEAATPHVVNELLGRAEKVFVNWQDYAKTVTEEAIKQVIIGQVRSRIENYLIKKIGKRIVPVVNTVSAVYDFVTGDEDIIRSRNAIACAILAIKGRTDEDTELAARVASKVVADAIGDKVIQKLVEHSAKTMNNAKLAVRKGRSTPDHKKPLPQTGPQSEPKHGQTTGESAPAAPKTPSAQSQPPPTGQGRGAQAPTGTPRKSVHDDFHEGMTAQERAEQSEYLRQQVMDAMTKSRALPGTAKTAKPVAADDRARARHTDDPKTDDPATGRNARAATRDTPGVRRTAPNVYTETGFTQPQVERLLDAPGSGFQRDVHPKTGKPISEPGFRDGKPLHKGRNQTRHANATYPDVAGTEIIYGTETSTGRRVAMEIKIIPQGESVLGHFGKQYVRKQILTQHGGRLDHLPPGMPSYLLVDIRMTQQTIPAALNDLSTIFRSPRVGNARPLWEGVRFVTGPYSTPILSEAYTIP